MKLWKNGLQEPKCQPSGTKVSAYKAKLDVSTHFGNTLFEGRVQRVFVNAGNSCH